MCVIIEDIQDIAASSTSIFLLGVLMSIQSSQKIRHKKITWSQRLPVRAIVLKKGGNDIEMIPNGTN